jgi:sporulation protein YlmC with PRC-barrel domain
MSMKHLIATTALSMVIALPAVAQERATNAAERAADRTEAAAERAADRTEAAAEKAAKRTEAAAERTADRTKAATTGNWAKATGDIRGSEMIGADVVNAKNDDIGSVKDVIFDSTGKVKSVLVDPDGVLNGGTKTVAIELTKLQILQSGEDVRLSTTMTEDQLKALPEYKPNMSASASATTSAGGGTSKMNEKK